MKMIRIFNAQPVKIPYFKSLLTRKQAPFLIAFFNGHIMDANYAKFQKSLMVEQFQGNDLKQVIFTQFFSICRFAPSGNSVFRFPRSSMLGVSGKQNSLFPLGPVIKCSIFFDNRVQMVVLSFDRQVSFHI